MTAVARGPVDRLAERISGVVLLPDSPAYDRARQVWNAMVDHRPQLIVRCADAADVSNAVRYAREHGLEIGVRCGGHNGVGFAVPDGGLMIDLSLMSAVQVDPRRNRASVQGGALLGALDEAAQRYGLATTAGNVSHTGVGGLTLGGGMGWLARRFGLACDNVTSYEVVTATGDVVRASAVENSELYWGLRGGGGNFGVVTRFNFRLHRVGTRALVAEYSYPVEGAGPAVRGWRDLAAVAPRPATFTLSVVRDVATIGYVWVGDPAAGRRLDAALSKLGRPTTVRVEELSYLDLQQRDDNVQGHAFRRYLTGHYLPDASDDALDAVLERGGADGPPGDRPAVSVQAYGGAIADVADEDAAFSHRDARFEFVASGRWTESGQDAARIAAVRRCGTAVAPFARGAYVNTLADEGATGVARAYPPRKLGRLIALKDVYDPDNVFHLNQNIRPSRLALRRQREVC